MCSAPVVGVGSELTNLRSVAYDGDDGADATLPDNTTEYPCLIRATDGKKAKFSTRVRQPFLPHPHLCCSHLTRNRLSLQT